MPEASFPVKRVNPRFSFVADAELAEVPSGSKTIARISELSSRGCYVDTINPVPIGTVLSLRIRYGCSTCEVPGKVIYTHSGYGMGVLFERLTAEQKSAIDAWLKELARKSGSGSRSSSSPLAVPDVGIVPRCE